MVYDGGSSFAMSLAMYMAWGSSDGGGGMGKTSIIPFVRKCSSKRAKYTISKMRSRNL
jgi:hypothetical protein